MKTSKVFRLAKEYLQEPYKEPQQGSYSGWSPKTPYICFAISKVPGLRHRDNRRNRKIIRDRLNNCTYADNWITKHFPKKLYNETLETMGAFNFFQTFRHAWLDQLIAEYEAKGD
jgi:hypothetical protein